MDWRSIEEEEKIRKLRLLVDRAREALMQSDVCLDECYALVENTKRAALILFPGKEDVYDLIYTGGFKRIIKERFTIPGSLSGRN